MEQLTFHHFQIIITLHERKIRSNIFKKIGKNRKIKGSTRRRKGRMKRIRR
jgi:hypothetical protein